MSDKNESLEARMKRYEAVPKLFLIRKVPVIIRLDGKAFHTFTKGFDRPFDYIIMRSMQRTMVKLCEEIQGCVFGYTQSDEITLILTDYEKITTDAWFGYNVQKMTSISASMATCYFNSIFREEIQAAIDDCTLWDVGGNEVEGEKLKHRQNKLSKLAKQKANKALFDSRVFNLPKDEVANCLVWRQQDTTRNSIEAAGQAYFSHGELHRKSCDQIQDMLFTQKGINWNNYIAAFKRGSACYKVKDWVESIDRKTGEKRQKIRAKWRLDTEIPIFTQNRDFIERWL